MITHLLRAKNTATESENKMHDDAVASTFGFRGGLVPGVDVYAYLCHPPAERWGRDWLERGTLSGRFVSPVYDGDDVTVTGEETADGVLELTVTASDGLTCATGRATLDGADVDVGTDDIPLHDPPRREERPPASAESLPAGLVLGSTDVGFHRDRAGDYLDDVGENLPLFRAGDVAHPGWLLRQANYILSGTVRLGPWIHVSSACRHLGVVVSGDRVTTRGRVRETFERKGHKLVDLDVLWVTGPTGTERPVMRARHVAIYEPRR